MHVVHSVLLLPEAPGLHSACASTAQDACCQVATFGRRLHDSYQFKRMHCRAHAAIQLLTKSLKSTRRGFSTAVDRAQAVAGNVGTGRTVAFDESILPFLVCPLSKGPLRYNSKQQLLISEEISVAYPIEDGIPILIPARAKLLEQETPGKESC